MQNAGEKSSSVKIQRAMLKKNSLQRISFAINIYKTREAIKIKTALDDPSSRISIIYHATNFFFLSF